MKRKQVIVLGLVLVIIAAGILVAQFRRSGDAGDLTGAGVLLLPMQRGTGGYPGSCLCKG